MEKLDKVIAGLRCCRVNEDEPCVGNCPYYGMPDCLGSLMDDVCEVLLESREGIKVEPVVHAHWERFKHPSGTHGIRCSNCKAMNTRRSKRCPECGAHMDGGNEDAV